jgi:metal-responsive CopG/Arc/MetJ family transcriptional regulator
MPDSASAKVTVRKISIDFPAALYEETETAVRELATNRSTFVRQAVAYYLNDMRHKKLEEELAQGYIANAACAKQVAEELMNAEGDLA